MIEEPGNRYFPSTAVLLYICRMWFAGKELFYMNIVDTTTSHTKEITQEEFE